MSRVVNRLRDYIGYAVAVTVSLTVALLMRKPIEEQIQSDHILGVASIALLVATVVRFFCYLGAVRNESDLMEEALDTEHVTRLKGAAFPITIGLSVVFSVLIAFAINILTYSIAAVIFAVLDIYGPVTINKNIANVLINARFRQEAVGSRAHVLYKYYFEKPIIPRVILMLLSTVAVLVLAIVGHYTNQRWLDLSAYALMTATILIGEVVIRAWRRERDRELDEVEEAKLQPE
jgi:hypothetical protein